MTFKEKIKANPSLKKISLWMLMKAGDPKPRSWVKVFVNPFKHKKGKQVVIRKHARMDVFPFNDFSVGDKGIIEDFAVINNGVGNVSIGHRSIIGIGSVIIGPVIIGNDVMLAQHVVVSGLNHGYEDVNRPPSQQPVSCKQIIIEDNVWIGANVVITAGITIGKHAIVGGGSVVTKNVPSYSVIVGNPAKIIKQYNKDTASWEYVK